MNELEVLKHEVKTEKLKIERAELEKENLREEIHVLQEIVKHQEGVIRKITEEYSVRIYRLLTKKEAE